MTSSSPPLTRYTRCLLQWTDSGGLRTPDDVAAEFQATGVPPFYDVDPWGTDVGCCPPSRWIAGKKGPEIPYRTGVQLDCVSTFTCPDDVWRLHPCEIRGVNHGKSVISVPDYLLGRDGKWWFVTTRRMHADPERDHDDLISHAALAIGIGYDARLLTPRF